MNQGTTPVLSEIRFNGANMTPKLRKIAQFISQHPVEVTTMSVDELAASANISVATIYRFCRELQYQTFSQLKLAIAKEISVENALKSDADDTLEKDDTHRFTAYLTGLEATRDLLDLDKINEVADLVVSARRIIIVAVGASSVAATFLHYKFMRAGLMSHRPTDMHLATMLASNVDERDMIIAFSASGGTRDIIDVLKIGRRTNASIVGITGRRRNAVADLSSLHLLAVASDSPLTSGSGLSVISQISVADTIYETLYWRDPSVRKRIDLAADSVIYKHV
ncbi:transcriptional regulator, RpiR family [Cohaesibacter sp. ES.047]|uniref:MurR/RpiR family transcriptional regulator n=1 Tax=Cohaesibacter sp. ES.047 TaxID=1798205 RepID=UPI000BB8744F|nr:MurR/RpiR family transcriptional regulator [Cohaesibacter sp. ES.047]SNY90295.1 transcriptional regulator, RpiR family [Cohaesibacter sp. ES.047]